MSLSRDQSIYSTSSSKGHSRVPISIILETSESYNNGTRQIEEWKGMDHLLYCILLTDTRNR